MPKDTDPAWSPDRIFDAIDTDSSGSIDIRELGTALTAVLGREVKAKEVEATMKKWDADGNGVLGECGGGQRGIEGESMRRKYARLFLGWLGTTKHSIQAVTFYCIFT